MGTKIPTRARKGQRHFKSALYSAFFEWILMILLFINALSSYLMHKFARYCKLPTPCILCARLYSKQPCLFKELTCEGHKLEVASLAYCHTHQKLASANKMCNGCHHASEGRVGADHNDGPREKKLKLPVVPKKDVETELRRCSCCAVQFKSRPRTLQNKPPKCIEVASLPGSFRRNRVGRGIIIGKSTRSLANYHTGDQSFERPPQVVGFKMAAASDSDSELLPFCDEDDVRSQASGADMREELLSRCLQATAPTSTETLIQENPDDMILEKKVIHPSSIMPESTCHLVNEGKSRSMMETGNGLDEDVRPSLPKSSEITNEHVGTEAFSSKLDYPDVSDSLSAGDAIRALSPADITMRVNQIMNDKLAAGTRSPLPSPASSSTEFLSRETSTRVPEELRSRLSQISSARWMEFPNEMNFSPRINGQIMDESKYIIDYPFQFKKSLSDQCESVLDSLDGSLMCEIEGEGAVDRLKRQIEVDRKSMCILYKELEEERNASAIAANQAMAMITRLQEEKAAMQMEALQYLRMMEEQAEYDQEALQKLNDLLADREKDIQDLEAVIETYSKQFGGEPLMGMGSRGVVDSAFDAEEREYTEYTPISTPKFMRSRGRENRKTLMRNTMLDFDDEKAYISSCLRRLERKLQMIANGGTTDVGTALNAIQEEIFTPKSSLLEIARPDQFSVPFEEDDQKGTTVVPERESSPFREDSMLRTCSSPSFAHSVKFSLKEALKESRLRSFSCNARQLQLLGGKGSDIISLGNEVSQLSVRLEALEEDRNFLEHTASSLRNGSDGLQFIQEIASHLRELRKVCAIQQEGTVA